MSPSGRLYLLTMVGLVLPTRGQTLEETTSISLADSTTVNIRAQTQPLDTVHPEPQTSTLQATVEVTATQMETQTQQPTRVDELLTPPPRTDNSNMEGTTPSKQLPDQDSWKTGPSEDDPFSYDVATLRKRGLLVAAVLFITGIVILTSGKCRQLPRLCRNRNR